MGCKHFIFDGISSHMMGVDGCHIVQIGGEDDVMPIFGGQSVKEDNSINSESPTFIGVQKENLKFTLTFSLLSEAHTPKMNYYLGTIFAKSNPVPFELGEDGQKIIYVTPIDRIEIVRLGGLKGYFKITLQAETPYWLTKPTIFNRNLGFNGTFKIKNESNVHNRHGNYDVFPTLKFRLLDAKKVVSEKNVEILSEDGNNILTEKSFNVLGEKSQQGYEPSDRVNFVITHVSDNNREIVFNNLVPDEVIEMDIRQIRTFNGENRFKDWNKEVFKLHKGINEFKVNYPCEIFMELQYQIFQ